MHLKIFSIWISAFLTLQVIFPGDAGSRTLACDSLILQIQSDLPAQTSIPCSMDTVIDLRNISDPRQIGIDEIKRYSLVPVDRYLLTSEPLTDIVHRAFSSPRPDAGAKYRLGIRQFQLSEQSFLLVLKKFVINARLIVFEKSNTDTLMPRGDLVFDSGSVSFFLTAKMKTGYESAVRNWIRDVSRDVCASACYLAGEFDKRPDNFRIYSPDPPWMQLFMSGTYIFLKDGFLADGRLHFVYPEVRRLFFNASGLLRYRHQRKFDSIEYGVMNYAFNSRLNPWMLFQVQSHLLFGLNR